MNLNLLGYITNSTSYGLVALNFLKGLTDLGINVATHGLLSNEDYGTYNAYVRNSSLASKLFDINAPCLCIHHQFDMATSVGSGRRIGYTFFEVNKLTTLEVHHLRSLDDLIVPSKWASEVCSSVGLPTPLVCPAGYDDQIFKPIEYRPSSCVFLSVGKWEVRKQQDMIVHAFNRAFEDSDNVSLWMSCDNRFIPQFVDNKKKYYKELLGDKLKLLGRVDTHFDLARIMQQSYCFVAPSLAEGWNLPLLEAMGCAKFNIATNYSGHTEFCTKESTLLIEPTGLQKAVDDMWFKENSLTNCGEWCVYDVDQLIEHMRDIYRKYKDGRIWNWDSVIQAKKYTWSESSKRMEECISIAEIGGMTQRDQNMGFYDDNNS